MDFERAVEIVNSSKTFEVTYNDIPIWIDDLDPEQQTALISSGVFPQGKITVPVSQLVEK